MPETDIIKALFAAVSGVSASASGGPEASHDLWPAFLDQLCAALDADSASLHLIRSGRREQLWHTGRAQKETRGDMQALTDIARLEKMRNNRVYSQLDLPQSQASPARNPQGRPPMGVEQQPLRALRCALGRDTGKDGFAVLILYRHDRDFRAAAAVQLSQLALYLGSALTCWEALEQERARAGLARRMSQDLGAFWLRLTPSGRVLDMAEGLREGGALRLQANGWLAFADPAVARSFRHALATAMADPAAIGRVDLSLAPPMQMLIRADPPAAEQSLIATLRQAPFARALPVDHVAACFDLSRSQARLTQLLCDGYTLQEAAQELGWTIETTRSCSKQIFARMETRSQAGVLRKVLNSAVWLRPTAPKRIP